MKLKYTQSAFIAPLHMDRKDIYATSINHHVVMHTPDDPYRQHYQYKKNHAMCREYLIIVILRQEAFSATAGNCELHAHQLHPNNRGSA